MSRRKEIDTEEYKRLYNSGMSFPKMASNFKCGVSTIQNMRLRLNLPIRERVYYRKEIDEERFRELYAAGATYEEIGDVFNVAQNTIMNFRLKLGLPDRDISLMRLDVPKFTKMYLAGDSYAKIGREFGIVDRTVQEVRNKLQLPKRQPSSTYTENEFRRAYNDGLTYLQLRKKFHISGKVVSMHIKELGLSKAKVTVPKEPKRPEQQAKTNGDKPKKFIIVPTLGEIRKKQLQEEIMRIERENKISRKNLEEN